MNKSYANFVYQPYDRRRVVLDRDRISPERVSGTSLALIQAEKIELCLNYKNKNQVRCSFGYNGYSYDLAVTDPYYDNDTFKQELSKLELLEAKIIKKAVLCISLGEPWQNKYSFKTEHYRLVSGILSEERFSK